MSSVNIDALQYHGSIVEPFTSGGRALHEGRGAALGVVLGRFGRHFISLLG